MNPAVRLFMIAICLTACAETVLSLEEPMIKWQDMKVIKLIGGQTTTGRRAHHQVTVGSDNSRPFAFPSYIVYDENITCTNMGPSASNKFFPHVEWNCTTDNLSFGRTYDRLDVSCECFNHCDDDYVWIGSCSVEYTTKYINFWWGLLTVICVTLAMIGGLLVFLIVVAILAVVCVWLTAEHGSRHEDSHPQRPSHRKSPKSLEDSTSPA